MAHEAPGRMFFNVPTVSVETILSLQLRVASLEARVGTLETMILSHRRNVKIHSGDSDVYVPRETEESTDDDPTLF